MEAFKVQTWKEVCEEQVTGENFWIYPYIVEDGITLLHGRSGSSKTPLTLNMMRALVTGDILWGLKVRRATPLLYLELDSPKKVIHDRVKSIGTLLSEEEQSKCHFIFANSSVNVLAATGGFCTPDALMQVNYLRAQHREHKYKVVFIDCLRNICQLDLNKDDSAPRVYDALRKIFPGASIVVIHHDKKENTDPQALRVDRETFSGSQYWVSRATVGVKVSVPEDESEVRLIHTKTQASAKIKPLVLLPWGGVNFTPWDQAKERVGNVVVDITATRVDDSAINPMDTLPEETRFLGEVIER